MMNQLQDLRVAVQSHPAQRQQADPRLARSEYWAFVDTLTVFSLWQTGTPENFFGTFFEELFLHWLVNQSVPHLHMIKLSVVFNCRLALLRITSLGRQDNSQTNKIHGHQLDMQSFESCYLCFCNYIYLIFIYEYVTFIYNLPLLNLLPLHF